MSAMHSEHRRIRKLATFSIAACAVIITSLIALIAVSFARPIYLWHGSAIRTHDGSRVMICDGVLMVERVSTSGFWNTPGKDTMIVSIGLKTIAWPTDLTSSPDADRAEIQKRRDSRSDSRVTVPNITLLGPSWHNYGGFESASLSFVNNNSVLTINISCRPLWIVPGAFAFFGLLAWMTIWLTRRRQTRRGFAVELIQRLIHLPMLPVRPVPSL